MKSGTGSNFSPNSKGKSAALSLEEINAAESYWKYLGCEPLSTPADDTQIGQQEFRRAWINFLKNYTAEIQAVHGESSSVKLSREVDFEKNPLEIKSQHDFVRQKRIRVLLTIPSSTEKVIGVLDIPRRKIIFQIGIAPDARKSASQQISQMLRMFVDGGLASEKLSLVINWQNRASTSISYNEIDQLSSENLFYDAQKRPIPADSKINSFFLEASTILPKTLFFAFDTFKQEVDRLLHLTCGLSNTPPDGEDMETNSHTDPIDDARKRLLESIPSEERRKVRRA